MLFWPHHPNIMTYELLLYRRHTATYTECADAFDNVAGEVSTSCIYKLDLFFYWAVSRKLFQDRSPLLLSSLPLQVDTQVRFVRHIYVALHGDVLPGLPMLQCSRMLGALGQKSISIRNRFTLTVNLFLYKDKLVRIASSDTVFLEMTVCERHFR